MIDWTIEFLHIACKKEPHRKMEDSKESNIRREWEAIQAEAPETPKSAPSPEQLQLLQFHKQRKQEFFAKLTPDQKAFVHGIIKEEKARRKASKAEQTRERVRIERSRNKARNRIVITPKADTAVSLGWNDEKHVFSHVLPFCSHTQRSAHQKDEDGRAFGGIDRRVFSNLFEDDEPLVIDIPPEFAPLMGHASNFSSAICAESFYMAAKCRHACDARFIMDELRSSFDVAAFGHNHLGLSETQKNRLVELGAEPNDFVRADDDEEEEGDDFRPKYCKWHRGKDGVMPVREGWYEIRHCVFFYILRQKFDNKKQAGSATRATVDALESLMREKEEFPLVIEHRRLDGFWGDAAVGSGYNVLGKTITQIFLEKAGVTKPVRILGNGEEQRQSLLAVPNKEIVDYKCPPLR